MKFAYYVYDLNRNGYLDRYEVETVGRAVLKFYNNSFDAKAVEGWLKKLDKDGNDKVTIDEFVECLINDHGLALFMTSFY